MEKSLSSVLPPPPVSRKVSARVALVDLKDSARSLLADCFRQFGIETVVMSSNAADRLAKEKLVLHEFRRYVRIPVMTEVSVVCADSRRLSASSVEMSSGGMSLKSTEEVTLGANVDVSFSLMTLPRVWVRGVISWRKPRSFGVRFDPTDERRHKIKQWIDSYLEI